MSEKKYFYNTEYWESMDYLVEQSTIHIDRPKNSAHPRFPKFIYPYDYGYLEGSRSTDQAEIDIWLGENGSKQVTGILVNVDLDKRDAELKVLYSCSDEEMEEIYAINNQLMMNAVLLKRIK